MWWLWIVGPMAMALLYLATDWRDKRRETEVEQWRLGMGPRAPAKQKAGYRDGKQTKQPPAGAKKVTALPGPLARILLAAGGGERVGYFELVPKLAYLAVMGGNATSGSDHQTVIARLDEAAPTFMVRPLPIIEGQHEANTGVQFKKDPEFMEAFIVERSLEPGAAVPAGQDVASALRVAGALSKTARVASKVAAAATPDAPVDEAEERAIRKWLSPPLREALMDFPDAWLRVEGKTMALTLYGPADADKLGELVTAADVVFAEYGAEGGPSLFGDEEEEEEEAAAAAPPAKKAASGGKKSAGKSA
jgi:hypothetical protein